MRLSARFILFCLFASYFQTLNAVEFSSDEKAAHCQLCSFENWVPNVVPELFERNLAQDKAAYIWSHMLKTRYEKLPEVTGPGFWGALRLFNPFSNSKSITHNGDFMIPGREKDIHHFGTSVMVKFEASQENNPYTGIFISGAEFGVARFSLAGPSSFHGSTSGMGLKLFVDGFPSVNLMAMRSLDELEGHNIFAHELSTAVPTPQSMLLRFLGWDFGLGMWLIGKGDQDARALSVSHFASFRSNGEKVKGGKTPYKLVFKPTADAQKLLAEASANMDFRHLLEGKGIGTHLYDVYAVGAPKRPEVFIGRLVTTSHFIASEFGDKGLFFKHHNFHAQRVTAKDDL